MLASHPLFLLLPWFTVGVLGLIGNWTLVIIHTEYSKTTNKTMKLSRGINSRHDSFFFTLCISFKEMIFEKKNFILILNQETDCVQCHKFLPYFISSTIFLSMQNTTIYLNKGNLVQIYKKCNNQDNLNCFYWQLN